MPWPNYNILWYGKYSIRYVNGQDVVYRLQNTLCSTKNFGTPTHAIFVGVMVC